MSGVKKKSKGIKYEQAYTHYDNEICRFSAAKKIVNGAECFAF